MLFPLESPKVQDLSYSTRGPRCQQSAHTCFARLAPQQVKKKLIILSLYKGYRVFLDKNCSRKLTQTP